MKTEFIINISDEDYTSIVNGIDTHIIDSLCQIMLDDVSGNMHYLMEEAVKKYNLINNFHEN